MGAVAVGVAIGAVVGGASAAIQSGGDFNAIWKGALIGGVAGGVGGAVAGWAAPALAPTLGSYAGIAAGALGGGAAGLIGGIGNAALNGGNSTDYLKGGLFGTLGGAAVGGITAGLTGFGSGEVTAPGTAELPGTAAAPGAQAGTAGVTTGATGVTPAADSLTSGAMPIGTGTEATSGNVFANTANPGGFSGTPTFGGSEASFGSFGGATPIEGGGLFNAGFSGGFSPVDLGSSPTSFGMDTSFSGVPKFAGSDSAFGSFGSAPVAEGGGLFNAGFGEGISPVASPSDVFLKGNDYGMTTSSGQVLDSYGNSLGNAPGFEAAGVPTVRGGSDLGGWSMDKLFSWDTAKDLGKGLLMSGGGKGLLGGIMKGAAIPNARSAASANNAQLMDLYNLQKQGYSQQLAQQQADAARNQQIYEQNKQAFQNNVETQAANRALLNEQQANAAGYNRQLSETYSNPNAYLNSPEAQASRALAMQKLLAQNTAAGRRSAGLGLQNQLMMNQLSNIGAYRQGLNSAIRYPGYLSGMSGMSYAPQTTASAAGMLGTLNAAQQWNPDFQTAAGLSSIFY
jgi:hypothetical protein